MRFNRWSRVPAKHKKTKNFYPYKNEFEYKLSILMPHAVYESKDRILEYQVESKYHPDFVFPDNDWLVIEAKGRFMGGSTEAAKYVWVKRCNPKIEIVFLFDDPNQTAYPGCRKRTDGSKLTMGEWASKNGFAFFPAKHVPGCFQDGEVTKEFLESVKDQQYQNYFGKERKK